MKDRIVKIMDNDGLTPSIFADKLGIGRPVVSHILSGRNNPSLDVILRISEAYPSVNIEWLLTGKGTMYKELTSSQVDVVTNDLFSVLQEPPKREPLKESIVNNDKMSGSTTNEASKNSSNETNVNYQDKSTITNTTRSVDKVIIYYNDKTFEVFNP